jgi:hypothetical protein
MAPDDGPTHILVNIPRSLAVRETGVRTGDARRRRLTNRVPRLAERWRRWCSYYWNIPDSIIEGEQMAAAHDPNYRSATTSTSFMTKGGVRTSV